ncbi:putative zinc finger protein [Prauserella shujinwangii]|uniref:Putative zinc finger protein n=1 Tax=Prauserella shujinwangii TaxID=1453103 RepID=A0A2T0LRK5_9PSEU|nr:zf-HC2 domain-containing protein [Prauserella shujinwangii]PRX46093.1 putative zinc finger protein [Prauserella shujinwangii]
MSRLAGADPDPFVTFDAAYVLGALSPEDQAAFEQHLRDCDACARSVRELAGMPGLLAQADPVPEERPSPELLPALLGRVRRERRRRRIAGGAAVAAAAAACLALVLALVLPARGEPGEATAMTPLGAYPVQASASVSEASWGTQVWMSCSYDGGRGGDYVLVAVRRDGRTDELASWHALPDGTAEMTVGSPLRPGDIQSLEIRVPDGPTVLRLPVSG